jgi:hypothetical protein
VLDRIGLALQTENALSLEARYPTDWHQMLPEGLDLTRFDYQPDHWFSTCATPADIFNLVGCYEYQACEHDAWDKSYAHAFCEWLFATAARKVPEGKLRTWNYEGPPADAPRVYSLTHLMGRGF